MNQVGQVGAELESDVARYRTRQAVVGGHDEMLGAGGAPGPDQARLVAAIDAMGPGGLVAARAEARRLVDDDGIQYGFPVSPGVPSVGRRPWHLDPLPIVVGNAEWAGLERGIQQRARLLGLILDDLYGERLLLRRRTLPAEVVLGHPGFIRQADGIRGLGTRLTIGAQDLGRDASGRWRVLADRTSAPSGSGYAMANRRIVSRVMPQLHRDTDLARLRGFFHTMRGAIIEAAPGRAETPRAVLFSPGAFSETAYDQSFLASLLGFPLVESDDLALRDGQVWMRSGGRLARVDAVIRRVDPDYCDPLELRADSQLGLPGLIEAARRGNVSLLNPIGAGVLENPGLAPFMQAAARALLGEDLLLPAPPTWWCGEATARSYVVDNIERLIVRRIDADVPSVRHGWLLGAYALSELRAKVTAEPWAWVGQEPLPLSTAPIVQGDALVPGKVVLRTFWVGTSDGSTVMPGGLGRIGPDPTIPRISSATGAISKDVWVLSDAPATAWGGRGDQLPIIIGLREPSAIAPRVADNLFWIGRYAARAEATARLLRVVDDLTEDFGGHAGTPGHAAMAALLSTATALTQVRVDAALDPHDQVRAMLADADSRGSVAFACARMVEAAQNVRDVLSYDIWHVLSRLQRTLAQTPKRAEQLRPTLLRVIESMLAVGGIIAESMVRDESWAYLDAGVRLERGVMTSDLLRLTLGQSMPPVVEGQVTEAILEVGESIMTHRRRTVAGVGPAWPVHSAVTLLLADRANPRSVAFQVDRLAEDFELVASPDLARRVRDLAQEIERFDIAALCEGDQQGLSAAVGHASGVLRDIARDLSTRNFARKPLQRTLPTAWPGGGVLR